MVHSGKTFSYQTIFTESHICKICNAEKTSAHRLASHMNIKHKKVPCEQCGKLIGKSLMKRHLRNAHTTTDEKKYKCEICMKFGCNDEARLKEHMNSHTGERPYKCNYCQKGFTYRSALTACYD